VDTKTFLQRVHAAADDIVICTHKPDTSGTNKRGFFENKGSFDNFDDAVVAIHKWDQLPNLTVYFSVGSFADNVDANGKFKRTQDKATKFKSLAVDIDVGEGKYETQGEAAQAFQEVCEKISLPDAMLVSSGRGIHAYWPFTSEISAEIWTKMSMALKDAFAHFDFAFDTSKICDPSMVLRPVGTHHKKQTPWKEVKVVRDCPDHDPFVLAGLIVKYAKPYSRGNKKARPKSAVMDAILTSNDVDLEQVASRCNQIKALVESGGALDASNNPVEEPMWRATLGFAKYTTDPQESIIALAGKHADFDLQHNLDKMAGWNATGPTTCATFERYCHKGCEGCPYRGDITSPAQLSGLTAATTETEDGEEVTFDLPDGYLLQNGRIVKQIDEEIDDGNGGTRTKTTFRQVSDRLMYVTNYFKDYITQEASFELAVYYPHNGWRTEIHEQEVLATSTTTTKLVANRQLFAAKNTSQVGLIREYILDYLRKIQEEMPTGLVYHSFGWQSDGTFLIGDEVLGPHDKSISRRLKDSAERFEGVVAREGTLEGWSKAMELLNMPAASTIRKVMFLSMSSFLSRAVGNCTGVISICSHKTNTGKTLAQFAVNSMYGHPKDLILTKRDTANAWYKIRGVLNQLPCTIDEVTAIDPYEAVNMVYDFSSGCEKNAMDAQRNLREPARWTGCTIVSTNRSVVEMFDQVQANDEALRARVIELVHDDSSLVTKYGDNSISMADVFFEEINTHYGHFFPDLMKVIMRAGGDREVWQRGREAFYRRFPNPFSDRDKYAEPMIASAWIVATIAKAQGMISFDVDATAQELIDHVAMANKDRDLTHADAFDIVNEYLTQHEKYIVVATRQEGESRDTVDHDAPDEAMVRVTRIYDQNKTLRKGSMIALHNAQFKRWLGERRMGLSQVLSELASSGALIDNSAKVALFKGCKDRGHSQVRCSLLDLTHKRFLDQINSDVSIKQSAVATAILQKENKNAT